MPRPDRSRKTLDAESPGSGNGSVATGPSNHDRLIIGMVVHACFLQMAIAGGYAVIEWLLLTFEFPLAPSPAIFLPFSDLSTYFSHASRTLAGAVPYRDFVVEYPPLFLPFALAPRFITSNYYAYTILFALEMLIFHVLTMWLTARRVARVEGITAVKTRLRWYSAMVVTFCPGLILGRFDVVPTFLAFAAADNWGSGRSIRGGVLAAVGTLVKIVPGVVVIPGSLAEVRRIRFHAPRGTLAFTFTLAAGLAAWLALGGRAVLLSIRYHAERGLEFSSLYAGILRLVAAASGATISTSFDHLSLQLVTPWSALTAAWAMPIQLLGLLVVGWRFRRSGSVELMRYSGAAILAFIILGKVFSPQYVLWLLPFTVAQTGRVGRVARPLALTTLAITGLLYPWGLVALAKLNLGWYLVLNLRNLLLLFLLYWLVFGPAADPDPDPPSLGLDKGARPEATRKQENAP